MNNVSKVLSWAGIILILIVGLIHALDAQDSFKDAIYKGWLFYANGLGSLIAAFGIYRGKRLLGWGLGFFIASVSFFGYIASRTIGLPFIPAEPGEWLEPLGISALITELIFMMVFLFNSRKYLANSEGEK